MSARARSRSARGFLGFSNDYGGWLVGGQLEHRGFNVV
jgi:hypothetical protein